MIENIFQNDIHGAELKKQKINDFCLTCSTVNGSGSVTANLILLKSIFRMGIPVTGKNIFPSNIQGLPTSYSLRVNRNWFLGRYEKDDIVVAMNPETISYDLDFLVPGGALFYADDIPIPAERSNLIYYPMPVKSLVKEAGVPQNLKGYLANMVYVGILAQLLGISLNAIERVINEQFEGKGKAIQSNMGLILQSFDWAKNNLEKRDLFWLEPMEETKGMILTSGNTAAALGAIYGGVQLAAWYPITPATSLTEEINVYMPTLRKDPITGKNTCAVVQAEDELAAIGMAVGAGWAGLRAMTATSGPGLSLMAEYLGLAYFAEIPIVVWDIQRGGPSTGLPTRTSQGDLNFVNFISHGDTQFIILIPGNIEECFEFGWKSFDIAERYQTPVIILSDLDLGMNQWISTRLEYPEVPMDRGKVLWEQDLDKIINKTNGKWGRYLDIDGDNICYRTLPGNRHPQSAYFTRGTGHDENADYSEDPAVWESNLNRLKRKVASSRKQLPENIIIGKNSAPIGIVSIGSNDFAIFEAQNRLAEYEIKTDYLRVRALPFKESLPTFISNHERIYVVENNQAGQLKQLITLAHPDLVTRLKSVAHTDGMPLSSQWIITTIMEMESHR